MDAFVIAAGIVIAALIIGAFVKMSRSSGERGEDTDELVRLREEKAVAESELESTRSELQTTQASLESARQFEIENARLTQELSDRTKSLGDEKALSERLNDALDKFQKQIIQLESEKTRFERDLKNVREQLGERDDLVKQARDSFKVLATQTLEQQQKSFMENASASLKNRQEAVEKLVKPLSEKIETLDKARVANAVEFREQMKNLMRTNESLASEAEALATALKRPNVRGRWGETQLERILDLCGMEKDIDYTVQDTFDVEGNRLRTDVIVHMPHERSVVLDSKVSMTALLDAFETTDEAVRSEAMNRHLNHVKDHINTLADKKYWQVLTTTPDMVVMVLPEFAFLPAIEKEPGLTERALSKNVIIVTPPALLALLKAVELTWQQTKVAETAKQISDLGRDLHRDLVRYADNFAQVGRGLQSAVNGYNNSVGTYEGTILGRARRFSELGVALAKEDTQMKEVTQTPRMLRASPKIVPDDFASGDSSDLQHNKESSELTT